MSGYLLIRDFRRRRNKRGQPYGWPVSVYATPEALWGYAQISSAYTTDPARSKELIYQQISRHFPAADEQSLCAALGQSR